MSRTILALSTVALLCASSQIAFADDSGAITGGVGGAVAGAVVGGAGEVEALMPRWGLELTVR